MSDDAQGYSFSEKDWGIHEALSRVSPIVNLQLSIVNAIAWIIAQRINA